MAASEQLITLLTAHFDGYNERIKLMMVAFQIAAHKAKIGHTMFAQSLKDLVIKRSTTAIINLILNT